MFVKLLYSPEGRVLGAQIVGGEGVDKRIDALAIAITHAWRGTGLLGAPEDSSVAVSISGRLTARGSMTPAQKAWAEAQAAQRRTGAVDPRRRRG